MLFELASSESKYPQRPEMVCKSTLNTSFQQYVWLDHGCLWNGGSVRLQDYECQPRRRLQRRTHLFLHELACFTLQNSRRLAPNSNFLPYNSDPAQKALTGSIFNQVNAGIQVGLTYSLGSSGGGGGSGPLLAFCGSYVLNDGATLKVPVE